MDVPVEPNPDVYARTAEFDLKCCGIIWSSDEKIPRATTVEPSSYDVPKLEANLYYAGAGPKGSGPKLIYRTSEDVFEEPSGPEAYRRLMRVTVLV